jgi:CHAT domain-containing protein/Tfp pilus assembly protein PilF
VRALRQERKVCASTAIVFLVTGGLSSSTSLPTVDPFDSVKLGLQRSAATPSPARFSEADKLDHQIQDLVKAGKYSEAIPLATQSLHLREKALGPEDPATATSLNNLGYLYATIGDYAKAEPLYQRALRIREKALGPNHSYTATSLDNLGLLYGRMADYRKAEPLLQRALKIREKELGPDNPYTAASLANLGSLYSRMADYGKDEKAEPLLQRALKIREKILGPEHPATAASLNDLAQLYENTGDYAKAEPLFKRALQVYEKTFGPNDPRTANTVGNLGSLYWNMSDYGKAEPLLQRALTIREKTLGPDHPTTGTSVTNLGWFYRTLGDYAKAEPLLQRALNISEKALGPNHPETATCLQNLAALCLHFHNYAKAEPLFQRALAIREKTLGPEHPRTGVVLDHIAYMYREMGDYAKAEKASRQALAILEKSLGPSHPYLASGLNQLALSYRGLGDYTKAKPLYERSLNLCEKVLDPENPETAETLDSLGFLDVAIGDLQGALRVAGQARRIREKNLSDILSFTSEQQRLAFQEKADPYDLLATIADAPDLAETVLRQKGIVLDSLLEDRLLAEASSDPKQRETVSQLSSAKQRLLRLQLETPKDVSEDALEKRDKEKKEISQRVEELEAELARTVVGLGHARRALKVTVPQVQAGLAKDETLIELLRYDHYLGKDKFEPRYGAVGISSSGEPKFIPLGNAAEIEKNIQLYQNSTRGKTDEATLSSVLRTLHTQIWSPIEKAFPAQTKTIVISPDGELSFVSFATLLGPDDKLVAEKYSVRYVASGRDLLREFKTAARPEMTIYANPDFGSKAASSDPKREIVVALRSLEMRDLQDISLPPLPGTANEAAALAKRFGSSTKIFIGPNATKAELRRVSTPRILHLATHGFFLPETALTEPKEPIQLREDIPKSRLVNPMHRSGLALAGAQTTLQAWGRGEVPPIENNGIVTAEEVGGLELNGTWLVVLSACDTGLGEARAGEGVMGLRRGFIQAGAQNLLMTLWPISDQTTVQIMLDFYDAADKTKNAPQALADVQRDWLIKLRKERGLLEAVRLAGAFIMSSQGKP